MASVLLGSALLGSALPAFADVIAAPTVTSADSSDYRSEDALHELRVRDTRPRIFSEYCPENYTIGRIGTPCEFYVDPPPDLNAVAYLYTFNDGPEQPVPMITASQGKLSATAVHGGDQVLKVRARNASGQTGKPRVYKYRIRTAPAVQYERSMIVGRDTTVRFVPMMPDVVEYEYWFGDGEHTVLHDSSNFVWLPSADTPPLYVRTKAANGEVSDIETGDPYHELDMAIPNVGVDMPQRPGVPVRIYAWAAIPEPTEFSWTIEGASDGGTVPVNPAGETRLYWTPPVDGEYWVNVHTRNARGAISGTARTMFTVSSAPTVTSTDYPGNEGAGGAG
ncbi:MAG: hypothetical protein ABW022_16300, partial [Actinoplanes sp.]